MPFDGIVTKAVSDELNQTIVGGRIFKVYQPSRDTIILHIRAGSVNYKLLLSSNANSARVHLTDMEFENPASPPMFCMLLRKHLTGGTILNVEFFNFERILRFNIEATDELGDKSIKQLVIEIMGRHSNIILLNSSEVIIDSVKHVDHDINRVREIMPARHYILPPAQDKASPFEIDYKKFISSIRNEDKSIAKILLSGILGFSPVICREICTQASIDPDIAPKYLDEVRLSSLTSVLKKLTGNLRKQIYSPCVVVDSTTGKYEDFHAITLTQFESVIAFKGISEAIDYFFRSREIKEQIKSKGSDIAKIIKQSIERCEKKIRIHISTLEECSDMDKYRLYGELITANIYSLKKGMKQCSLLNYYDTDGSYVDITLDEYRTPQENAQWYYKKYNKAKTAHQYASEQLKQARWELDYLDNVLYSLEEADSAESIEEIREELREQGYIRKTNSRRRNIHKSEPYEFTSSDGYPVWVGRNNVQNDELTLKMSNPGDLWLHTKNIPGSHVIARVPEPIPDKALLEAAGLAAWFSKAKNSSRVEVDYTRVKYVRKPAGAKPGMVIYVNYHTVIVDPLPPEKLRKQ